MSKNHSCNQWDIPVHILTENLTWYYLQGYEKKTRHADTHMWVEANHSNTSVTHACKCSGRRSMEVITKTVFVKNS